MKINEVVGLAIILSAMLLLLFSTSWYDYIMYIAAIGGGLHLYFRGDKNGR